MNKFKIIMGYVFALLLTIFIFALSILLITKITIFNKNYVKKTLEKNNYYNIVASDILEEMKSYMISSGLSDEILDDLYTNEQVKDDINSFIDYLYGSNKIDNKEIIKNQLVKNIDENLKKSNITITDQDTLDLFVDDMIGIYDKEITLYGYTEGYISLFNRVNTIVSISTIILAILVIICILIMRFGLKVRYVFSSILASGLLLLFIKLFFFNRIDIDHLLIVTGSFSNILRFVLNDYVYKITMAIYSLIVIGLLGIVYNCFTKDNT